MLQEKGSREREGGRQYRLVRGSSSGRLVGKKGGVKCHPSHPWCCSRTRHGTYRMLEGVVRGRCVAQLQKWGQASAGTLRQDGMVVCRRKAMEGRGKGGRG